MKIVIPPECQLGAHTIKIVWSRKLLEIQDARGGSENLGIIIIRLRPDRPRTSIFQTLIHELLHQIDFVYHLEDFTDGHIQVLSAGLAQSLLSMGIEPDFSQIPEEKL